MVECRKTHFVEYIDLSIYASIMMSFLTKKSPLFLFNDIFCRDIILSLHFLFLEFFRNISPIDAGVSLQNKRRFSALKKLFFRLR